MTRRKLSGLLLVALLLAANASWAGFMAGAAKTDITPDVHKYKVNSIGYFSHKVMTSVLDRQMCQALAVSDGSERAVIVTCDLMGTPPVLRAKVLGELGGTGIDDRNFLMSCSHTHSGPGNMMPNLIARIGFGAYNEALTQEAADRIAGAAKEALATMRPAAVAVARTELDGVTRNRRDPAGSYDYDTRRFSRTYDPGDPKNDTDPTLTVVKVDGADGSPIALLFHFATHGTVLGPEVTTLSADWPGYARAHVEEGAPGYVVMYMNGAQGDQAPAMDADDPATDIEYLDIIGKKVADGVLAALPGTSAIAAEPVRAVMERREVAPSSNKLAGMAVPKALIHHYFPSIPLQAVRMGDLEFMALPVEAVCEVGKAMRQGAEGAGPKYALVAGLANDHGMYVASPDDFDEGGYEVDNTVFGRMEAGLLIGEQLLLTRKLYR